jgi:type IV pilus assembly protein PilA
MHSLRQRINKDESGFTLIELLVVLIIIGILLAIAVPSYLGFRDKAQQTAAASNVREAIPSAEAYYGDYGNYNFTKKQDGTAAGSAVVALQSYDSGMDSGLTVIGAASNYCISEANGTHYAAVVGPGGKVKTDKDGVTGNCTSATAAPGY